MNIYCQLAKQAIRNYLKNGTVMKPSPNLPTELLSCSCGVFITIKKGGALRGCIGTWLPTKANIAEEIISNAIVAATRDNRFLPLTLDELDEINIEVSLLTQPELIESFTNHNPRLCGLIVQSESSPYKVGLLLPDLDGIDNPEKQFSLCCQKADIDPSKESVKLYRFRVIKYQS